MRPAELPRDRAFGVLSEALHSYLEVMGLPRGEREHEEVYEVSIDMIVDSTPDPEEEE